MSRQLASQATGNHLTELSFRYSIIDLMGLRSDKSYSSFFNSWLKWLLGRTKLLILDSERNENYCRLTILGAEDCELFDGFGINFENKFDYREPE